MFMRILKKDLKRKKTMNIILLLFVIMCSMFAAASTNNIIAVTGGIEHYFEISNAPDATVDMRPNDEIKKEIENLPSVSEVKTESRICILDGNSVKRNGKKMDNYINMPVLISDKEFPMNYFDDDEKIIKEVPKGCFYAISVFTQDINISADDKFQFEIGDAKIELEYAGRFRGAFLGNDSNYSPCIIMNHEDYDLLYNDPAAESLKEDILYVNTSDIEEINQLGYDNIYVESKSEYKGIYIYDMFSAYIMLAISVILMITSFVMLRFTVGFTISEEFHEIGVMKAIGMNNGSIRSLYIVKYFAISAVGSVLGFFGSIPLGNAMMKTITKNIIFVNESSILTGALSSVGIVAIIMLFCYGCTRKVNKLSPIDAVRNGQTGERFGKKSIMHLGRSKLPTTGFLSFNDIISSPKRFIVVTLIFSLCMLMMTIMSVFALTLKSEKILYLFDIPTSEAHIADLTYYPDIFTDFSNCEKAIERTDKMLADNGISGKSGITMGSCYETFCGDKKAKIWYYVSEGLENDLFRCDEGYAPEKFDEIAMTGYAMEDLGAEIGDRVRTKIGGKEYEFIITGKFSTFQGSGHSVQLSSDFDGFALNDSVSCFGIQVHFDGNPNEKTIADNIEKIKTVIGSDKVYTTTEMIKQCTQMSDTINAIKKMMMILTVVVTIMVVILMERSFISKEKSEIALMKAVGISNGSVIAQHAMRFVIVSIIACAVSLSVLRPLSNVIFNWICSMIGDVSGAECDINPVEVFAVCPAILIGITVIGSFLTALYTRTIKASDAASIE